MINFRHLIMFYLVMCLVAILLLAYLSEGQVLAVFSKTLSTLDYFYKALGVLWTIMGIIIIVQNYLGKRHKKTYWQELSDDAQQFLNTFARAHPDIQRAILRILEIQYTPEDEQKDDFGYFLNAYRENSSRLQGAASRVLAPDPDHNKGNDRGTT